VLKTKRKQLSAGQRKLESLNVRLPLLPITTVGSLPKYSELKELRYKVAQGFVQANELERRERIATESWVREQGKIGLDVLVDGEMQRGDLVSFFAERIEGFEMGGTVRTYGNRYYRKPIIKRKLAWKGPMSVDLWQFAQRATHGPVKAVITGPYTLMDWSFNEFYSSREAACQDLVEIIRRELKALTEAGAKIIQIDEPALSSRLEESALIIMTLKDLTSGMKAYLILHHCYGDLSGLWPKLQRLPIDNSSFETANSNFSFLPWVRKNPTSKDVTIGVLDSHSHLIETPRQIAERVKQALRAIPARQLWISPDCGLKTRTAEEAVE